MNQTLATRLRTLLVLGRVSNLPTVWSNCLAGWWLAGAGPWGRFVPVLLGVSSIYIGGMYLNDAFDAEFDRQRRAVRPIPSGQISELAVWRFGWGWLVLGLVLLWLTGRTTGFFGLALVASVLVYNITHKFITASPFLMGLCRFWVYVIAGTTGLIGVDGWPVWGGLALASYIVGLSYVARRESFRGPIPHWPLLFLAAPFLLALLMDPGEHRRPGLEAAFVLALWMARCLPPIFKSATVSAGRVVSGLLAGIVLVDCLAVAPDSTWRLNIVFVLLFAATQVLQRYIPAT
jgi:4-hydroxybenzoate polyprenyltransferase